MDNDKETYDEEFFDMLFSYNKDSANATNTTNTGGGSTPSASENEPIIASPPSGQ